MTKKFHHGDALRWAGQIVLGLVLGVLIAGFGSLTYADPLPTVSANPTSCSFSHPKWSTSRPKGYKFIPPYGYANNMWNYHSRDYQTICVNRSGSEWAITANMPDRSPQQVQSYPEQINTKGSGRPVHAYRTLKACVAYTTSNLNARTWTDIAFDTWLDKGKSNVSEVMVWLNHRNDVPSGSDTHITVSDESHSYDLWRNAKSSVYTFVAKDQQSAGGCVDLKHLYTFLHNKYNVNENAWSEGDFGAEIASTHKENLTLRIAKTTWTVN